jgi:hypothetical protein
MTGLTGMCVLPHLHQGSHCHEATTTGKEMLVKLKTESSATNHLEARHGGMKEGSRPHLIGENATPGRILSSSN